MPKNEPKLVEIGSTAFVQACARMMSATWIRRQIAETSTAPPMGISGIAYTMRFTVASDIGMAFELAVKSDSQELSLNKDGEPQVPNSHDLLSVLWEEIPGCVRLEIDQDAEDGVCETYGDDNAGKVLSFAEYLDKHKEFLNRAVDNRYAIAAKAQWKSDHSFIVGSRWFSITRETYNGRSCVDGIGVLFAYWRAIMKKARDLRWDDSHCGKDKRFAAERDEAWNLVERAVGQAIRRRM